ncbi:LysR family transcriptional regulator [Pontivivens ytuae]|uniref:LysR family transcriptional regulator n=1 Tax=Pontivivens ytuae TaxID=2789856 RepID=A0A7S9QCS2_9RHOB|nr:LysR family transcriptional regulator [Pontivivens ytuae]QPH54233.1 LysR family transcriptional regulator [Pontivivens ytuae]
MPLSGVSSLDDLRLFFMIHEAGSISGAARRFGVSKATLSRALARLEEEVGMPLFDRLSSGLKPTQTAEMLLPAAEEATRAGSRAEDLLRRAQGTPNGELRIAASALSARQVLGPVLARMAERYPEVQTTVQITALGPDPLAEDLDVVLRLGRPPEPYLIARRILKTERALYVSRQVATRVDLDDPKAVAQIPRIQSGVPGSPFTWTLTDDGGTRIEIDSPPACIVGDPSVELEIVRSGYAMALLPKLYIEAQRDGGDLVRALPVYAGPDVEIYASFPPKRASVPAVRVFIDLLVEGASEALQGD